MTIKFLSLVQFHPSIGGIKLKSTNKLKGTDFKIHYSLSNDLYNSVSGIYTLTTLFNTKITRY